MSGSKEKKERRHKAEHVPLNISQPSGAFYSNIKEAKVTGYQ